MQTEKIKDPFFGEIELDIISEYFNPNDVNFNKTTILAYPERIGDYIIRNEYSENLNCENIITEYHIHKKDLLLIIKNELRNFIK